jgi:CBS domain-containing protein
MNAYERPLNPMSCRVHDHLQQAAKIMSENDCTIVPVVDPDGCVVGVITARAICVAACTQCKPIWHIDVGSAMSR